MELELKDLTLVTGCMFAGKSKFLIDNFENKDVQAIQPTINTRDDGIRSRDYKDRSIPTQKVDSLSDVELKKDVILVDEFQFFKTKELRDFVRKCKDEHRKCVMAGLNYYANGNKWEAYNELESLADEIITLSAKCSKCGEQAQYTQQLSGLTESGLAIEGEGVTYEPRCKKHWSPSK